MMPRKLPNGAVSKLGTYSGLGDAIYKSYALTSQYVAVRDGTKLVVDTYRPQDASGKVVAIPLARRPCCGSTSTRCRSCSRRVTRFSWC
jgi:predicted acyl esterase